MAMADDDADVVMPVAASGRKRVSVAYFLWFVGGWFGLHHFYLRRDRQAFVWCCTLGGGFGIGLLRDLVQMSEYVAEANGDAGFEAELAARASRGRPAFSLSRFAGEIIVGWLFGTLARCLMPEGLTESVRSVDLLLPPAIALGVCVVADIGHHRGSYKVALLAAYLALPLYWREPAAISWGALAAAVCVTRWGARWELRRRRRRHVCRRAVTLAAAVCLYAALWGGAVYFNSHVTLADGDRVTVRDALSHFFTSQLWRNFKEQMAEFCTVAWRKGWDEAWEDLTDSLDPEGEYNAHEVLGVSSLASEKEVKAAYRRLVKEWHPDLYRGDDPAAAQHRFMQIQQAYEVLSTIKTRRARRNRQSRSRDPSTFHGELHDEI